MLELLGTYSLTQIVTFIVPLAIAVKEGITLVIWFKDLFKKKFNDDMKNTIATMIIQLLRGNFENVFMCVLTLILFLIPIFIDRKLNIKLA